MRAQQLLRITFFPIRFGFIAHAYARDIMFPACQACWCKWKGLESPQKSSAARFSQRIVDEALDELAMRARHGRRRHDA